MSDPFLIPVALPPQPDDAIAAHQAEDGAWQRQHISAFAFGLLDLLHSLLHLIPAVAALGLSGNSRYIPLAAAGYLGLHLLSITLRWLTTSYRITDSSVSLRDGVFARNTRHIGFDRIQDISIEQNFLARALNVAKLGVDTGAGGKGDDFSLYPITLPKAEALRETLRAYRQQQATSAATTPDSNQANPAPIATPEPTTLFTMPPRLLLLSGLFTPSLAVIAFAFALIGLTDRFGYDLGSLRAWERIAQKTGVADWLDIQLHSSIAQIALIISLITLFIALLGIFSGIVRAILRDWDFRLTREPRALRRTRGLTTRTDVAITIRRIQSATITTGLIRQYFGWHELRLRSLASDIGGPSEGGDHQALPFAQMAAIHAVLDDIQLRPNMADLLWHRSHPIMALPAILLGLAVSAIGIGLALLLSPFGWFSAAGGLVIAFLGILSARRHFYAQDGRFLLIRSGLLRPSTTILPAAAIQSADICDNFVYRRFGLATLAFGVPGISSFADDQIPAIPIGKALALRDTFTIRNLSL